MRNLRLKPHAPLFPNGRAVADAKGRPTHPVFVPCTVTSRTPVLEMDYNLHKSNSTYFTDLDVSRTALVSRLYSPGVGLVSKGLDAAAAAARQNPGPKQPIYIALGSVYCSFKREIKPYVQYEVESRVIAWDEKWLYVVSYFMRPRAQSNAAQDDKVLFASALSKYVVKKGRLTVAPERVLQLSGFLPARPAAGDNDSLSPLAVANGSSADTTPAEGVVGVVDVQGIVGTVGVDGSLVQEVLKLADDDNLAPGTELESKRQGNAQSWDPDVWTWDKIDMERRRGLKVVESYSVLDNKLYEEWKR